MNFFSDVPGIFHFRLFGFWHIVLTITMLLAMVLIYKYQEALRKWKYHDKAFRYIVAGIMFTNMAIYYGQKYSMEHGATRSIYHCISVLSVDICSCMLL